MNCPYCDGPSRVVDSRPFPEGGGIRRRRECQACRRRFTTHERLAPVEVRVVKERGRAAEPFAAEKIVRVLERVAHGRPLAGADLERIARGIEADLLDAGRAAVTSAEIARVLLGRLRAVDEVAAERFAVDYRDEDGRLRLATAPPEGEKQLGLFETG